MWFAYFGNMATKIGFTVTAFVICNVINQILAQDDANGVGHAKGMCATGTALRFSFHLIQSRSKQLQESN